MSDVTHLVLEFKLYPTKEQADTLDSWLRKCCWLYNHMLRHRISARKKRKQASLYDQSKILTTMRSRLDWLRDVPRAFLMSAVERVDIGMRWFFRRCREGAAKKGFPRFKNENKYKSMQYLETRTTYIGYKSIRIPGIGKVRARGRFGEIGKQKSIRIIRKASGWYAHIIIERPMSVPLPKTGQDVGIDLGLKVFLATDAGEMVANPRHLKHAAKSLRKAQRRLSRCKKGSNRRKEAANRVGRLYETLARKRRGFCHRTARNLINRFDRIGIEDLNIKGLSRSRLRKSVLDASWGTFVAIITEKAESAGREIVKVNPAGTSQECPQCGAVVPKKLSERSHRCGCGCSLDRDQAAAMVVRQRAFRPVRGEPSRPSVKKAGLLKRKGSAVVELLYPRSIDYNTRQPLLEPIMDNRPAIFTFADWRNPQQYDHQVSVDVCLTTVAAAAGNVPMTLDGQPDDVLLKFSQAAMIVVADLDVEPALFFPNRVYANREFVKATYLNFIKFCRDGGWFKPKGMAQGEAVAPPVVEDDEETTSDTEGEPDIDVAKTDEKDWGPEGPPKKKRGRQRKDAVPA